MLKKSEMNLKHILENKLGTTVELLIFFSIVMSTFQLGIIIPLLVIIYIVSVKTRRLKFPDLGFYQSDINFKNILLGIILAGLCQLIFGYLVEPALKSFLPPTNIKALGNVKTSIQQLLVWLLISWTVGAFFEELVFRGYLINRLIDLFGTKLFSKITAVVLSSVAFGFMHYYQGIHGVISTGIFGIFQAILYFVNRRKLFVNMILHGTFDTISFIILYFN